MKAYYSYVTPEQMETLWSAAAQHPMRKGRQGEDLVLLIRVAYYCALRMSEALGVRVMDIDCEKKVLRLGKAKTDTGAQVYMPPELLPHMVEWTKRYASTPERYIMGNTTVPMTTMSVWLKALGEKCNIAALTTSSKKSGEKTLTHAFRKSWAKELYWERGVRIELVRDILRHDKTSVTQLYLKLPSRAVKDMYYGEQKGKCTVCGAECLVCKA